MKIIHCASYSLLSAESADFAVEKLRGSNPKLLCAATGNSPTGMYHQVAKRKDELNIPELHIIKLDEWQGLPMEDPGTCETYLRQHLLGPLEIPAGNYISFNSMAADPKSECRRIKKELDARGPIDLCVLGLGLNGHLALNEPADEIDPTIHLAQLAESSQGHSMISHLDSRLTHGYTLGLADILQSRSILLLVNGLKKKPIFDKLMTGKISTQLPASFLWLHPDVTCFYSEE